MLFIGKVGILYIFNINLLLYVYIWKYNGKNIIIMNLKSVELIKKYIKLLFLGY